MGTHPIFESDFDCLTDMIKCLLALVSLAIAISDPWAVLGVDRGASQKDIKKAYKKLAIQWHPDKNDAPEAEEKFMEIADAYQILTDDDRRREWEKEQGSGGGFGSNFRRSWGGGSRTFGGGSWGEDIFKQFFGASNFGEEGISTHEFFSTILEKTNRTPYIFLFTSPWCFGCQSAKRSFTLLEQEFRKYGYGTGRINANIQPKLTQFMHVKVVPSLVIIYEEMIHHIPTQDVINGNFKGVRDMCEGLISNKYVHIISNLKDGQNFLKSMDNNLRPKVIIFSDKTTPTSSFKMLSSQFRGEIDFAFAYHHDHDISDLKTQLGVKVPSLLFFKTQNQKPDEILRISDIKRGNLYEKAKSLRKLPVIRISSQEQFNDICEIDYEQNGQADKLKCILYLHFGALDSERVKQFRQWGASKQAEFKDYARMVIISADQNPQFGKYFGGDSAVFVLKRYKNNIARVKMILHEDFGSSFTGLAWKAIFDFDSAQIVRGVPHLVDETLSFSYFELISRTLRQYYQRLRHLEEEELLIYIALPLSCIMLSATFFMKNDTEPRIKKPKNYRRQQRQLVEYRNLNKLNRSEIEKFCSVADGASKVMVVLVINDADDSEASQEVTREMKKQYFQKIQDYQYDPRRPEFFIINSDKCVQEIAPELDLIPGTVLALKQNWWAAYQIDVDDDIYLDNILPHFEHWLARLQDGSIKRNRYDTD